MNKRLIDAREKRGLTQEKLANEVGIDRTTYAHYERGRNPKLDTAIKIAQIVKKPVEYLFLHNNVLKQHGEMTGTDS